MATCARCDRKISWKVGHLGDHLCADCRQAVAAEHADAEASYQAVLGALAGSLGDVVSRLGEIRSRERPEALTADEQLVMDVAAFTLFVNNLIGDGPLSEWTNDTVMGVASALGATRDDGWRDGYEAVGDKLWLAFVRGGLARPQPISGDFVPNRNEGTYLRVPTTRVWERVDKELKLDETGIEVGADGKVAVTKGKISGHEIERRRTTTKNGVLVVTTQRLVFVSADPILSVGYREIGRIRTADGGELVLDVSGLEQPWRFRFAKPGIVQSYVEFASSVDRGSWRPPAVEATPETPPVDDETENLLERAGRAGLSSDLVRQARLYQHLGILNRDGLEQAAQAAPDAPLRNGEGDSSETGDTRSRGIDAAPSGPSPRRGSQADREVNGGGQGHESFGAAMQAAQGRADLAELCVEIRGATGGTFVDRHGRPIVPHGVLAAVALRVWNTTKEVQTLRASMFELVEDDGTRYSTQAGVAGDQLWLLPPAACLSGRVMQPKMPEDGVLLFDLPRDVEIVALRVSESFGLASDQQYRDIALPSPDAEPVATALGAGTEAHARPDRLETDAGGAAGERGPFPDVPRNGRIWDYSDDQLRAVVRWVKADGQPRDDDMLLTDTMHELGFRRRGSTISDRIGEAIGAER